MYTTLHPSLKDNPKAQEASSIVGRCVHCGFCNATCPTYQITGDELDGPRGRIYLMKQLLEQGQADTPTQQHLDRCLTCRNCETTCPSGVEYGRLVDIGRHLVEEKTSRSWPQTLLRKALLWVLPYPQRFKPLLKIGLLFRSLLPASLKAKFNLSPCPTPDWPISQHPRRVLLLEGCVQRGLAPHIDGAAAVVLDRIGISVVRASPIGCCGTLPYHLNDHDSGLAMMRQVIDQCEPFIEQGIEAIIMTASGCGVMLKDYASALRHDPVYAEKAKRFSALAKDISELLLDANLSDLKPTTTKIAFQAPCTLQHGQKLSGTVERILLQLGFELVPVENGHLCCGSAGTYSILQPELAQQLRANKLQDLQAGQPSLIATANIGCLLHLQEKADVPIVHWLELLRS